MSADTVRYTCDKCGWTNNWTRDEVVQRKQVIVYRDDYEEYSLPCKNPNLRPACPGRYVVAVPKRKK